MRRFHFSDLFNTGNKLQFSIGKGFPSIDLRFLVKLYKLSCIVLQQFLHWFSCSVTPEEGGSNVFGIILPKTAWKREISLISCRFFWGGMTKTYPAYPSPKARCPLKTNLVPPLVTSSVRFVWEQGVPKAMFTLVCVCVWVKVTIKV